MNAQLEKIEKTEESESAAKNLASGEGVVNGVEGLEFETLVFENFEAEFSFAGKEHQDYVVHFYFPKNVPNDERLRRYWLEAFPVFLDQVSQSFFNATAPRLRAAYTEENASWWFRAYGFASGLAPVERIQKFFEKLNQFISAANQT